ncbi:MAG: nucleoside kinase [Chloroflexi bacterium HGW-Chloroflexi-6]|nr:MAG: nucleoside kinase [Chloroflexi bacterium HGW-Chloroflexi-6]
MDITTTSPSLNIQVHLPDGRTLEGPRGATAEAFLQIVQADYPAPIVGAIINGDLHELTYAITMESRIQPVTMADADGSRIYRRSLTFLLEAAFSALFPKAILLIDHSVASGGYYCHVHARDPLTEQELANLETEMRCMQEANLPFVRQEVTLAEAIAHFEAQGYQDKVRLFAHRQKPYVTLYQLGEHLDYHHGYMVPATGYLKWFALAGSNGGFTLRFPRRQNPTAFSPLEDFPKLLAAFRQYGGWLERLGTDSVGALNDAIQAGRARELILVSEALHEQHIAALANQIAEKEDARLVLIAGPSSSGKTTFSRRLAIQLLARGLSPFALEMDNYFVDRDDSPKDENGEFDFETVEALNLNLLGKQLEALLAGQEVQIPRYNFSLGKSEPGDVVSLRPGQLIILEGIHGLNPRLIPASLARQSFRLYVSALTQLNLDRHNRVSTTDTRLIRRIVRDARERGYSAAQTINRWESVRRGEKRHIFPYQENTDVMFNSALAYEMSVLRPLAEPLLRQVTPHTPEFIETKRLLAFLEWFLPLESDLVPDNSILREFIGGSILKGFKVWGG